MNEINRNAINEFYSVDQGTYNRTGGFNIFVKEPDEKKVGKKTILTYTYKGVDVAVNPWMSPWDIEYTGDSSWAFDTGFVHGLHGGPRPRYDGWSWDGVKKTEPIWEIIVKGINQLE